MKTHTFKGHLTETIEIDRSGETWHLAAGARVTDVRYGITASDAYNGNRILVDGRMTVEWEGISTYGDHDEIRIGRSGAITTTGSVADGIITSGNNVHIVNSGRIMARFESSVGIEASGEDCNIENRGTIEAFCGIFGPRSGTIVNAEGGRIEASSVIFRSGYDDARVTFLNHGLAKAGPDAVAVLGASGSERIVNDGRMIGDVLLAAGDDTFDARHGTFAGILQAGLDDDTLITDDADIVLTELSGEGSDTVRSTVSYTLTANVENLFLLGRKNLKGFGEEGNNQLHGNDGANVLRGRDGNDKLFGGAGNDRLYGGSDVDFFQFATGWDRDRIADFEQGLDLIDLSIWKGIDDFTDILHHAHDSKVGVIIAIGHDSLTIEGISRAELVSGDFMF